MSEGLLFFDLAKGHWKMFFSKKKIKDLPFKQKAQ